MLTARLTPSPAAWVPAGQTSPRATVQAALADPSWLIEVVCTAAVGPSASL